MERTTSIEEAKKIFGRNFIGIEEINEISTVLGVQAPNNAPEVPYSILELEERSSDSILILGSNLLNNGGNLNLLSLREWFGTDPDKYEPCFYNQDWYLKEDFMKVTLENRWYLINKNVFDDSRAIQPDILEKHINLPKTILCAYVFFAYWFHAHEILWQNDFVWCSDKDHNGDRIYIGKYVDIDGINKNGFSIHRHLTLRHFYGAISSYI